MRNKNGNKKKKYAWKVTRKDGYSWVIHGYFNELKSVLYIKNEWVSAPKGQGPLFCFKTRKEARNYDNGYNHPRKIHKVEIEDVVDHHPKPVIFLTYYSQSILAYRVKIVGRG